MEQFVIRAPQVILTRWGHAPTPLPPTMQEKLSRCGDDAVCVRDVLPRLLGVSISAEVSFFADVGQELYMEFPALAEEYLAISDTSQAEEHLRNAMRELAPGLPETYPFALT